MIILNNYFVGRSIQVIWSTVRQVELIEKNTAYKNLSWWKMNSIKSGSIVNFLQCLMNKNLSQCNEACFDIG